MVAEPLRRYSAEAMSVAKLWFDDPFVQGEVELLGEYSPTADGACPVRIDGTWLGFMKPRPDAERKLVVAREKIAADLAHLLDLPVAPVGVLRPQPERGWAHPFAISLVCLPGGRVWQEGGAQHLQAASRALEALRVFWTWIGDADHNDHGGNLLYEVSDAGCYLAAIDHSYSLCHGNTTDPLAVACCFGYGTATLPQSAEVRETTIAAIEALDPAMVEHTICRLGDLVTAEEQDRILHIVRHRQGALRTMLQM